MRDPRLLRVALAGLLGDMAAVDARGTGGDERPPRLRLQDWRVFEQLSIGANEYMILTRIKSRKDGIQALTTREQDVAAFVSAGLSNKEIAHRMGISSSTVRVLLSRVTKKVGATDRRELIDLFSRESG